jgi:hypothetical protein
VAAPSAAVPGTDAPRRLERIEALPSVVVFAGEESFLADEGVAAVTRALFPAGEPAGAVVTLDATVPADAERVPSVVEELATPSLFGEGKLVVVRRAEAIGGPAAAVGPEEADDGEEAPEEPEEVQDAAPAARGGKAGGRRVNPITALVKQACAASVPGSVLVLVTRKPARGKGSVSTETLVKAGALVFDARPLYDAPPPWARGGSPYDTEAAQWTSRRARARHGKAMDLRAAQALVNRLGAGLAPLARSLETLASYVGDRPSIVEEDVAATVGTSREDPSWVLADAVLDRDLARSLALVAAAFDRGISDAKGRVAVRPESVFPMLSSAIHAAWRRAMLVAEAAARGENPASLPALAGLPSFVVERLLRQAGRRDPDDLLARHAAFVEAEAGVRGGGVPPRLALERLVVSLAT